MEADKQKDEIFVRDCPIRNILSRISDKWSILVIFTLEQTAVMRFGELQRAIPDISQKNVDGDFEDVGARWYCKPPGLCPDSSEGGVFVDIAWAVFVAPVERAD